MDIFFEESFEKDLQAIKDKKVLKRVRDIIDEAKKAMTLKDIRNIRKLKGYETYFRIRLGDYRIGIELVEERIVFTRILHRKDIYRYFP